MNKYGQRIHELEQMVKRLGKILDSTICEVDDRLEALEDNAHTPSEQEAAQKVRDSLPPEPRITLDEDLEGLRLAALGENAENKFYQASPKEVKAMAREILRRRKEEQSPKESEFNLQGALLNIDGRIVSMAGRIGDMATVLKLYEDHLRWHQDKVEERHG
jgi:hypothetical protein